MRVVVIGASGNVGTAVVRRLREADVDVVGISRRRPLSAGPFAGVEWREIDLVSPDASTELVAALEGADAVIHLAWLLQPNRDPDLLWRANVEGTRRVVDAAAQASVPHVLVMSSIGAYSAGPKGPRIDESWPTDGISSSHYGREKAAIERLLDRFENRNPDVVVTRIRPGLVMHDEAALEVTRYFLGPLIPTRWLRRRTPPVLPLPRRVVSQVVHATDLADAIWRMVDRRAPGPFNIAAEPIITPARLAEVLGARWVPVRMPPIRALLGATWRLRLQQTDPGWLDLAVGLPVMSTERARRVLGWQPRVDSLDAVAEVVQGVGEHESLDVSPPLSSDPEATEELAKGQSD
jgi:nucleoside-diphosphate-sugar epimerase